jgi:superfamily II DNA helicase RecQ
VQLRIWTLPFHPTTGFDDSALQAFLADKDLVCFWEHLFTHDNQTHLICIVEWESRTPQRADPLPRERIDPTSGLSPSDELLYETLRSWRANRAQEEGLPAYRILTNRQLREIVERKPFDEPTLAAIPGIGPARAANFGAQIFARLDAREAPLRSAP